MDATETIHTIRQAIEAGDRRRAGSLLVGLLQQDPNNDSAWVLAAELAPTPERQADALERALMINPANLEALRRLSALHPAAPESPLPPAPPLAATAGMVEPAPAAPVAPADQPPAVVTQPLQEVQPPSVDQPPAVPAQPVAFESEAALPAVEQTTPVFKADDFPEDLFSDRPPATDDRLPEPSTSPWEGAGGDLPDLPDWWNKPDEPAEAAVNPFVVTDEARVEPQGGPPAAAPEAGPAQESAPMPFDFGVSPQVPVPQPPASIEPPAVPQPAQSSSLPPAPPAAKLPPAQPAKRRGVSPVLILVVGFVVLCLLLIAIGAYFYINQPVIPGTGVTPCNQAMLDRFRRSYIGSTNERFVVTAHPDIPQNPAWTIGSETVDGQYSCRIGLTGTTASGLVLTKVEYRIDPQNLLVYPGNDAGQVFFQGEQIVSGRSVFIKGALPIDYDPQR